MYACGFQFHQPHASQETARNTQRIAIEVASFIVFRIGMVDSTAFVHAYLYAKNDFEIGYLLEMVI